MNVIDKAIELLNAGEVIGLPTETVYGLAGSINHISAIEKIFKVKDRPFFDPLIVHVANLEQAQSLTKDWSMAAEVLANKFWPGPLTLVLQKSEIVSDLITSGLDTVGIRMPNHPLALELISKLNVPLAAPSANKFGRTSPTTAQHVLEEFRNENIFIIDGGPCEIGIESTVVSIKKSEDLYKISILRKGAITESEIKAELSLCKVKYQIIQATDPHEAPGHMKHHYMPSVPLIICEEENLTQKMILDIINAEIHHLPEAVSGIKIIKPSGLLNNFAELRLDEVPALAARKLYSELRVLSKYPCIVYFRKTHKDEEAWAGIYERLYKAASLVIGKKA